MIAPHREVRHVVGDDVSLTELAGAIARGDHARISRLLAGAPELALAGLAGGATRRCTEEHFLEAIRHQVYAGDTALHIAAAAYEAGLARELVELGALVGAANRRGAQPLHYAVDGGPGSASWNPVAQQETVLCLVELGADPNAVDKNGTSRSTGPYATDAPPPSRRCSTWAQILVPRTGADPRRCSSHAGRLAAEEAVRLRRENNNRRSSDSSESPDDRRVHRGGVHLAGAPARASCRRWRCASIKELWHCSANERHRSARMSVEAAAVDLERIAQGGIPLGAEERLKESLQRVRLSSAAI